MLFRSVALAKNPLLTPVELMTDYLFGPDFSTGAMILGRSGIKQAYETGSGSITIRSRAEIKENEHSGKKQIIVTEIPYQVNKATLVENIAHLVRDKVVEGITDIRDESSKGKVRVVIDVRHDCIPEVILNQLYKLTQLQTSMGIIMLSLVDGAPKILPINEILLHYLNFQINVVERRTNFLLKQDEARLHIVDGLLKATEFIDEIVKDIRAADTPDEASATLMSKYGFSELQTQAILAMTLRRLTGLEEGKLEAEKKELETNIASYHAILASRESVTEVVVKELLEIKDRFSDERMTEISDDAATIEDEDLIPQKDIVIVLTTNNYVKRMTTETFRTQHRGGRGVRGMSTNGEDSVNIMVHTETHTDILFFSNLGRVYRLRGYMVPEESRTSKGLPIQNLLNLEKGEKVVSILPLDDYNPDHFLFFATKEGIVKRTRLGEFKSIRSNGKIAIVLRETDSLLDVKRTNGEALIGLASSKGKMVKFPENDVRPIGRTATGVKGMDLDANASLIGLTSSLEGNNILVITLNGYGKMSDFEDYRQSHRGTKGVITLNVTNKNGRIVAMRAVKGDEDLMMITNGGTLIRMPLSQIKVVGRNTQGVRVIRLDDEKQRVSSIAIISSDDISGEEETPVEENPAKAE